MTRIRLRDGVTAEDLKKYGFTKSASAKFPDFIRQIDGKPLYRVYFTAKHRYMQIYMNESCVISASLQKLIFELARDGIIEEVEEVKTDV